MPSTASMVSREAAGRYKGMPLTVLLRRTGGDTLGVEGQNRRRSKNEASLHAYSRDTFRAVDLSRSSESGERAPAESGPIGPAVVEES
jgi:hypothetical protein